MNSPDNPRCSYGRDSFMAEKGLPLNDYLPSFRIIDSCQEHMTLEKQNTICYHSNIPPGGILEVKI